MRGPRSLSGLPKVTELVGEESHPGRHGGKSKAMGLRSNTTLGTDSPFIYALELWPHPPHLPTEQFADALSRTSLLGPESLGPLVVNCLPHPKMVNSFRSFMFPRWGLPAVAWKRERKF